MNDPGSFFVKLIFSFVRSRISFSEWPYGFQLWSRFVRFQEEGGGGASCTVAFGIQRYILRNVQYPSFTLYSPFQSPRLLSNTETNTGYTPYILLPGKTWLEKSRSTTYQNATLPSMSNDHRLFRERVYTFAL